MASTEKEWVPQDNIIAFSYLRFQIYAPKDGTLEALEYRRELNAFVATVESKTPVEGWTELVDGTYKHPQADKLFKEWLDQKGIPRTYPEGYVSLESYRNLINNRVLH